MTTATAANGRGHCGYIRPVAGTCEQGFVVFVDGETFCGDQIARDRVTVRELDEAVAIARSLIAEYPRTWVER